MTLDDWILLTAGERAELMRGWKHDASDEWWSTLHEAAERFKRDFGSHREILYVSEAFAYNSDAEPQVYIDVCTRLPHGQQLADLPAEYQTFSVIQDGQGEAVAAFKKTWSAILERIFDWDAARIQQFIRDQEPEFHSGFFLHVIPVCCMPRALLADSLLGHLGVLESNRIGEEIVRAIIADGRYSDHFYLDEDPEFDWIAAKRRVETVIAKYRRD
jgi:hypothetical protein